MMKVKLIDKFLGGLAVIMLAGLIAPSAISQPVEPRVVPSGKTEQPSSQLILWYDSDETSNAALGDLDTFIMVVNTSNDTPVNVHVQVFRSFCTDFSSGICQPGASVICAETNFNDFFTPNDAHFYDFDNPLTRNDPLNNTAVVADFTDTKGFVVITPIDGPSTRNAIAHQHMMGTSYILADGNDEYGFGLNAMGRDAVSFSTGNVVPDGTILDGVSNGYVLIQPEILKFNFNTTANIGNDEFLDRIDIVSIVFRDNYEGVFGYVAEPADATWTPLIFDEDEQPVSCSTIPQNCFFNIGLNNEFEQINQLLAVQDLCPGNSTSDGWVKMAIGGLEGLENEIGLVAFLAHDDDDDNEEYGFATWMYAEGPTTPVAPLPECTVDADCAEGEVCEAGTCVPAPECTVDADCAEGEVCEAGACVEAPPECTVDTDCAEGQVCALGICIADPGGGGGGCAIASTATAGTAAANALVVLIPLLGIGLRAVIRRRDED